MMYLKEYKSFYKTNDIVLIQYWYNDMITPVIILEKVGNKYLVSHNTTHSEIRNAPDELISLSDILDRHK